MIVASIPIAAMLLRLLLYALGSGKVAELGRLLFFAGALTALLALERSGAVRLL
jgi:hypothetical protein